MKKAFQTMLFSSALFLLLLTTGSVWAGQTDSGGGTIDLPSPTGPYAVGRKSFHWTDSSRGEDGTENKNARRELMVHISYPVERTLKTSFAPYLPNLDLVKAGIDSSEYDTLRSVRTHTMSDAKLSPAKARYPVIVISHGNQMSGFLYTSIIEDLASNGYIVAAIDHPYEAIFIVFPDNRVVSYSEKLEPNPSSPFFQRDLRTRIDNRASDIAFVVTELSRLNAARDNQFTGRLDLARVGVAGHSNGGTAAVQACQIDKRLQACLNLDGRVAGGPFYAASSGRGPQQPLMYLAKPLRELTDEELAAQRITREQAARERAATLTRDNELMRSVKSGSYRVIVKAATHESFSDEALLRAANELEMTAERKRMRIVREYVRAFFDKYLKRQKNSTLDSLTAPDSEVTVERFEILKK